MNIDNLDSIENIEPQFEQQSSYTKLIDQCQDKKQRLYERFVLQEMGAEQYKVQKSEVDAELARLNRAYSALAAQTAQKQSDNMANAKAREIAVGASRESGLTQALVDLLIDRVYVYPENHLEIVWKVTDFTTYIQGVAWPIS